jgi:hypothetical protein
VQLWILHPELPSCDDCERFAYDEHWKRVEWPGSESGYMERFGAPPPCSTCPKCSQSEEKSPAAGRQSDLSPRNIACFDNYLGIRDGGLSEDEKKCPLARRTRAILSWYLETTRQQQMQSQLLSHITQAITQ